MWIVWSSHVFDFFDFFTGNVRHEAKYTEDYKAREHACAAIYDWYYHPPWSEEAADTSD